MTTERKIAANRANAKRSSGPKSRAGKARASQNAYRHGLAACMTMNADRVNAMDALAREIQASMRGQIDRAGALAIAQAELEVLRVRAVLSALFAEILNGFGRHRPATGSQGSEKQAARRQGPAEKPGSAADHLAGGIERLKILDRYLRRVHAKRDRAVRLALEHVANPFRINSQ
jgi:hypothetical protein